MSDLLMIIIMVFLVIFAVFGFLIVIEYLRYFKRKIVLRLREKLNNEVTNND